MKKHKMIQSMLKEYKVEGYYLTLLELKALFELCFNVKDIYIGEFPNNEYEWSGILRYDIKKEVLIVEEQNSKDYYFYFTYVNRLTQLCNEDVIPEGIYFISL